MKPTFRLMIKTHQITGLRYLCVTSRPDFYKYIGSGVYWRRHLKIYGRSIRTEVLFETEDIAAIGLAGEHFSNWFDVVDSNQWANLTVERGYVYQVPRLEKVRRVLITIDGISYSSLKEAKKQLGITETIMKRIRRCSPGREYVLADFNSRSSMIRPANKAKQVTIDGNLFECVKYAANSYNLSPDRLRAYCKQNGTYELKYNDIKHLVHLRSKVKRDIQIDNIRFTSIQSASEATRIPRTTLRAFVAETGITNLDSNDVNHLLNRNQNELCIKINGTWYDSIKKACKATGYHFNKVKQIAAEQRIGKIMSKESNLAISLWEGVHDYLPAAKRFDAAVGILRALEDFGFDKSDLAFVVDEDPYLEKAYADVFADDDDEEDNEHEEDR